MVALPEKREKYNSSTVREYLKIVCRLQTCYNDGQIQSNTTLFYLLMYVTQKKLQHLIDVVTEGTKLNKYYECVHLS